MIRPAMIALLLVVANPAIAQVAAPSGQAGATGQAGTTGARKAQCKAAHPVQALA